jgi:hypothetical protein
MFAWDFVVWQEKLMVEEATMVPQSNLLKKAYYCPVMLDGESVAEQVEGVTLLSLHPSSMLMRMWEHVLLERHLGHHSVDHGSFLQLPNVDTEKSRPFSFLKQFTESPARSTQELFCILNSIERVACHMNLERERERESMSTVVCSQSIPASREASWSIWGPSAQSLLREPSSNEEATKPPYKKKLIK